MAIGMHLHRFVPAVPVGFLYGVQAAVVAGFLVSAIVIHRSARLYGYWRLTFAFFVAALAVVLSDFTGNWALRVSSQSLDTARGLTVLKLAEDATIVGTIILFVFVTRDDRRELFLTRGRLGLGLAIGLSGLLVLTIVGVSPVASRIDDPGRLRELLLVYGLISLADGLMEELLFRGLFLKRLARFVGEDWANVVTALVFTFAHQLLFETPSILPWVFFVGFLFGWIMQKTESVLASVLLHAGVDMVIIESFMETYYGVNVGG
jgi:membrane protease YdiL (CAAX protease family)